MRLLIAWTVIAATLASPCAWDTDPREIAGIAALLRTKTSQRPGAAVAPQSGEAGAGKPIPMVRLFDRSP
jgi:hypothetical protein